MYNTYKSAPQLRDIRQAAERIRGVLLKTPLIESEAVNRQVGGRLFVKAESLQKTGSFKTRGAWNRLTRLNDQEKRRGVVAFSAGNHGQAVAWAARRLGLPPAVVVMPHDAPRFKIEATKAWGAEIILLEDYARQRAEFGRRLAENRGLVLVHPYDDYDVIAGAGTVGLEIVEQLDAEGVVADSLLVCCAGGGLAAGCAIAVHSQSPDTQIWAVEPEGFDDTAKSLQASYRVENQPGGHSHCDALLTATPGELTFSINKAHLIGGIAVSDRDVETAMRVAARDFKLAVEPGGAAALAAVVSGRYAGDGRTTVVVLTGANVDPETFHQLLAAPKQ